MAILNRYSVRIQQRRVVIMHAQNLQHAKQLAIEDVLDIEDAEKITTQGAKLLRLDSGESADGLHQLNEYEVKVRFRRNIVLDALDNADARLWALDDQGAYDDTVPGSMQVQQVTFMKEKTGVA